MTRAAISGMGACTPLGLSAAATEAAFRAGLMPASEIGLKSGGGEPIRALYLDLLPKKQPRCNRMVELAAHALDDLTKSAPGLASDTASAFVGLPELDEESFGSVSTAITSLLRVRMPVPDPPLFFCQGRSALFFALAAALDALSSGDCERAVVGAVDSLCAPETLQALDAEHRLLGPDSDGIIPGEGAAFLLLERSPVSAESATIVAASTGREARHFRQSLPNNAKALTGVLRALRKLPAARGRQADLLFTCETGEHFWSQEFALAYLRNAAIMPEPLRKTMAAESFGDLGAAAGSMMLVMGVYALSRMANRRQPERLFLLCGCSDDGHLGACLVEGPRETVAGG
jgi:3-oxoacyl-[acyl-carrier-protein] synthase I